MSGGSHKIIKIAPGVSVPRIYGVKAAGNSQLVELQPQCTVPYLVPDAWAVPPLAYGDFSTSDIRVAFDDLTKGLTQGAVLMARSSATDEMPGKNPTLFTYFDPDNIESSFKRFAASVDEVLGTSRTMGVLLTKMVGDPVTLPDGQVVIGRKNVSFVADSHNPVVPEEMSLSLVHGLGTKVVEAGPEYIAVTVDRKSGLITSFGDQTKAALLADCGSLGTTPRAQLSDYRQLQCDGFDVGKGQIVSRPIDHDVFSSKFPPRIVDGMLTADEFPVSPEKQDPTVLSRHVKFSPFGNVGMFQQLTGALQMLSRNLGPVQIEGAYCSNDASALYLYQLISVPELTRSAEGLTVEKPLFVSNKVIGRGKVQLPLIVLSDQVVLHFTSRMTGNDVIQYGLDPRYIGELQAYDAQHKTGYALLAPQQGRALVEATPHCRVRLSETTENLSSHAVTLTRYLAHQNPDQGYMMAMEVKGDFGQDPAAGILVYDKVRIESNGRELRLKEMTFRESIRAYANSILKEKPKIERPASVLVDIKDIKSPEGIRKLAYAQLESEMLTREVGDEAELREMRDYLCQRNQEFVDAQRERWPGSQTEWAEFETAMRSSFVTTSAQVIENSRAFRERIREAYRQRQLETIDRAYYRAQLQIFRQEVKEAVVFVAAGAAAEGLDALVTGDTSTLKEIPAKLPLDGAAVLGTNLAANQLGKLIPQSIRPLGVSGLKLGGAAAVLQMIHSGHVNGVEVAMSVAGGLVYSKATDLALSAMNGVNGLARVSRLFRTTPGSFVLATGFMFGMKQVSRAVIESQHAEEHRQIKVAVAELVRAVAQIRQAGRGGIPVEAGAVAQVRKLLSEYGQVLRQRPDVDALLIRSEHDENVKNIRKDAVDASYAAKSCQNPERVLDDIDHNETVALQREERRFQQRLLSLREEQGVLAASLPTLEMASEFHVATDEMAEIMLPGEINATQVDGHYASSVDELLADTYFGMASQLAQLQNAIDVFNPVLVANAD